MYIIKLQVTLTICFYMNTIMSKLPPLIFRYLNWTIFWQTSFNRHEKVCNPNFDERTSKIIQLANNLRRNVFFCNCLNKSFKVDFRFLPFFSVFSFFFLYIIIFLFFFYLNLKRKQRGSSERKSSIYILYERE